MSKIIENAYLENSVVFDVDYRTGSIADKSPYKAAATVTPSCSWCNTRRGYGVQFQASGKIAYADSAAIQLANSGATFVFQGNFRTITGQYLLSKRGASGVNYDVYLTKTTNEYITLVDSTSTKYAIANYNGSKMLVITYALNAIGSFYIDGTFAANFNAAFAIQSKAESLYVGALSYGTSNLNMPLNRVLILNRALSPAEISQLYTELTSETYPLKAYSFGSKISAPKDPPGVTALLKTDFTTRLPDGRLADLSGNGWHGTIKQGFVAGPGMCGNSLVATSASRTYVDFGDVTPINGASKLTVLWYGEFAPSGNRFVYSKSTSAGVRNDYNYNGSAIVATVGSGNAVATMAAPAGKTLASMVFDGELAEASRIRLAFDAVQVNAPNTLVPTAMPSNAGTTLNVGNLGYNAAGYAPQQSNDLYMVYPAALTPEQVGYVYRQIARRSTFALDMQRVPVSLANLVGPCEVPNTPFRLQSGSIWKISEDTNGKRWVESVAGDNLSIYMRSSQAYGTWVVDLYHTNSSEYFWIIGNSIGIGDANRTAYSVALIGTDFRFYRFGPGTSTLLFSAGGAVPINTKYSIAVTRSSDGKFTNYIKGGIYLNWTKVTPTSGVNPVTDTTYTTSNYQLFATGTAVNATKFSNPRMFQGVLTESDLDEIC